MVNMVPHFYLFLALCELFDKADTGGDGTISIPEYIAMCEEYGVALTEEHINTVKAIANENGEVYCFIVKKYPTTNNLQVRKNDFIYHIKASNMFSLFESIDPDSHSRWQTLAVTAFKSVSEKLQVESKDPTFQVV